MVGRATFTMKKSMRGSAAASSTVNSPRPLSTGAAAGDRTVREAMVSVTLPSVRLPGDWYQSVLILVEGLPGNRIRAAADWSDDDDGTGDGDGGGSRRGDRGGRRSGAAPQSASTVRRHELAAFLRHRREHITPSRSACRVAPGAAHPACAARRSRSSPRSGSPGTRGSNRPGTSRSPSRSSTPSPAPCSWTAANAPTSSSLPVRSTPSRPRAARSSRPPFRRCSTSWTRSRPACRTAGTTSSPTTAPTGCCSATWTPYPGGPQLPDPLLHARGVAVGDRAPGEDPAPHGRPLPRLDGRPPGRPRLEDPPQAPPHVPEFCEVWDRHEVMGASPAARNSATPTWAASRWTTQTSGWARRGARGW